MYKRQVHQNRRWDVDFLAMKQIHDSGELGKVLNIESRIHGSRGIPSDWRGIREHGGGMLFDWGIHLIDQLLQIFTGKIERIYCTFEMCIRDRVMIEQMGMSESTVQEYVVSMDDGKLEEFIGQMIACLLYTSRCV